MFKNEQNSKLILLNQKAQSAKFSFLTASSTDTQTSSSYRTFFMSLIIQLHYISSYDAMSSKVVFYKFCFILFASQVVA